MGLINGDAINLKSKLGEALNWQELIHTSYFEVPEFIDLIALQLGNTGFGPLKDGFASDYPARVKLDAWLKRGAQSEPDELLQPG